MATATAEQTARNYDSLPGSIPELMDRLRGLVESGTTELAPSTLKVPVGNYSDPAIFAAERKLLLHEVPLFIGPSQQVPNNGDYFTRDILERPILTVRDQQGKVRVFQNACRHRGALVAEGAGCSHRFTCPYHAWTFSSSGKLIGLPGAEGFSDIERDDYGLVELPSAERHGLIFAMLDPAAAIDIDAHLGTMGHELALWNFAQLEYDSTVELDYDANWKSALEAFSESYHFPYVHGTSSVGMETISNTVAFDDFGPHHRIGVPLKHFVDPEKFAHQSGCSVLHWVFPNLIMASSRMGTELIDILPGADPSATKFRHSLTIRGDLGLPPEYKKKFGEGTRYAITQEDPSVVNSSSRGLRHAVHDFALIGRNEPGPRNIHLQIQQAIGQA